MNTKESCERVRQEVSAMPPEEKARLEAVARKKIEEGKREARRAKLRATVDDFNDSSDECLLASGELREMQLEDELEQQKIITRSAYAETNVCRAARQKAQRVIDCANQYFPGLVKDATAIAALEDRARLAESQRDELRDILLELLTANATPSITGFTKACEKARAILKKTNPPTDL